MGNSEVLLELLWRMLFNWISTVGGEEGDVVENPCDSCPCELPPKANPSTGIDAVMAAILAFTAASVMFWAVLYFYVNKSYRYKRENAELHLQLEMMRRQLNELEKATATVSTNTTTASNATLAATCSSAATTRDAAGRCIDTPTPTASGILFTPTTIAAGSSLTVTTTPAAAWRLIAPFTTTVATYRSNPPAAATRSNAATPAAAGSSLTATTNPAHAGRCTTPSPVSAGTSTTMNIGATTTACAKVKRIAKLRNFIRELQRSATTRRFTAATPASVGRSTATTPASAGRTTSTTPGSAFVNIP
ncbi:uncharacterized protein LOC116955731 isoform X1 [Petromyzon marinus]|uniref:Ice-structuring glycoprotein-like n=1 Tax=Petromyzon marinus TaxID=7757 RepID=A0AAJ7UCV2_PETMA|nr:ice-structuring glycoprotein-like [Petromyzon marinus]